MIVLEVATIMADPVMTTTMEEEEKKEEKKLKKGK